MRRLDAVLCGPHGPSRRAYRAGSWLLLLAFGVFASSCDSKQSKHAPPVASALVPSGASNPGAAASSDTHAHSDVNAGVPHSPEPMPMPPAASATSLSSDVLAKLTTVRVSAHVGSVILRKEGGVWVVAGQNACRVPARRIERALENLVNVKAVPSTEVVSEGTAIELQIVALIGEERLLHFEVADRNGAGDLVRLINDTTYRMQGLDRTLWSTNPAVWCLD